MRVLVVGACSLFLAMTAAVLADSLRSDELILVYTTREPAGAELARYYAKARGVPADRLCPVDAESKNDGIDSEDFERLIRQPVRDFIIERGLVGKVRGLVTFFGLPLRVNALKEPIAGEDVRRKWQAELTEALRTLHELTGEVEATAGGQSMPAPLTSQPAAEDFPRLASAYVTARQAAFERVSRLHGQQGGEAELQRVLEIVGRVEGTRRVLAHLAPPDDADGQTARRQLEQARQAVNADLAKAYDLLTLDPHDPARDRGRQMLVAAEGILTLAECLANDLARLETERSEAAVDSELMLLWWRMYPRGRWVLNPLNWRWRADPALFTRLPPGDRNQPVLFVSRLDGPTPSIVRRMIDHALRVEKTGLTGRAYIDARGRTGKDGIAAYDQNLRDLASLIQQHTSLPVVLDDREPVFPPRRCPDAALYCGWYSVRKYVDSFSFVPGSVGYHVASFEAMSLRRPQETGWCRGLLLRGVAATLGAVDEPYLQAFPPARDFFGLLLTGQFTLAECYAYTLPFNSWMMLLLGDPLYRPFAANSLLSLEQAFEPNQVPPGFRSPTQ